MTTKLEGRAGQVQDDTWPKFADEREGQFGIRTAFLVSALACFIAAIWYMSRPTAVIAILQINSTKDEITGTISQTEPPIQQDGTPAHPYSDASQCPARTDLVFWPSGRSVPSIPPSISVCFVGNQPFESSGPVRVEMRDR
jgi:hypothetical protein